MQKELEEIKILLNKIDISNRDIGSSETENIINNKVKKIKDFIDQNSEEKIDTR